MLIAASNNMLSGEKIKTSLFKLRPGSLFQIKEMFNFNANNMNRMSLFCFTLAIL